MIVVCAESCTWYIYGLACEMFHNFIDYAYLNILFFTWFCLDCLVRKFMSCRILTLFRILLCLGFPYKLCEDLHMLIIGNIIKKLSLMELVFTQRNTTLIWSPNQDHINWCFHWVLFCKYPILSPPPPKKKKKAWGRISSWRAWKIINSISRVICSTNCYWKIKLSTTIEWFWDQDYVTRFDDHADG